MIDFTKDELQVLADAIDMMVRTEGNAMAQAGSAGLKDGRAAMLGHRMQTALSALAKIEAAAAAETPPPDTGG